MNSMKCLFSSYRWLTIFFVSFVDQFSSVAQSCPTLCDPMNRSTPGLPVHHQLLEFTQTHIHRVGEPSSHLILCCPLLLLSPIPPSIRVFSNESTLRMRWPKYWSFSFSIIPSKDTIYYINKFNTNDLCIDAIYPIESKCIISQLLHI